MFSVTTIDPSDTPASPRRLAVKAEAAGFEVTISEARQPGSGEKAWGVTGRHADGRRFQAYWSQTPDGGCKAVGQVVGALDGKGDRAVRSAELSAWIAA